MPHHEKSEHQAPKPEHKECHCDNKCECGCNEGKCGCGCGCCCGGKKFIAKLIAAIIIFLAGFGCAHLFCCGCHHHGKAMSAPHAMMKHKAHHDFTDGASNIIIINSDGKAEMVRRPNKHFNGKKHHRPHHMDNNMPAETEASTEAQSAK